MCCTLVEEMFALSQNPIAFKLKQRSAVLTEEQFKLFSQLVRFLSGICARKKGRQRKH